MSLLGKRKKNKSCCIKRKMMSLTCIKHLNMSGQPCIVGNVGTTFKKKRLNKSRLSLASLQFMLGFSFKEQFIC